MEQSHFLMSVFVVLTLVIIASANHGEYKILGFGENYPAYPWRRVNHRERVQPTLKRYDAKDNMIPEGSNDDFYELIPTDTLQPNEDGTYSNKEETKKSNSEEQMTELNNYGRVSGAKVIYGRLPVRVIQMSSYPKPKQ